jgi:VCBS repeat-containing protein
MRKIVFVLLSFAFIQLSAGDNEFTERFEKRSVFGKWIDIDKGKIIEINSHTKFSFERLDNDLIILKNGSNKSYLKRVGSSATKIKGRIVQDNGTKTFNSASDTTVTITNVKDKSIKASIKTNKRGYFSDASLPSGEYMLSVKKGKLSLQVPVTLNNASESLGTFVLTKKKQAVFKSTLSMDGTYVVSNGKRYKAFVDIYNYGNKKGRVCYSGSIKDKRLKELRFSRSCKVISAGKSVKLPLFVSFKSIAINSTTKELNVKMTDKRGRSVVESHPFDVYKNYFNLKIKSPNKAMKAYIVLPGQEVKTVNIKKGRVALPKLSDEEYTLILANTDPRQKTVYEVDIGAEEKLSRGVKKKKKGSARRGKRNSTFALKQSIARYPDIGDIAIYNFMIPDAITMQEHDDPIRIRFSKKNRLGEKIKYKASISNSEIASVTYKDGFLTVTPKPNRNGVTTITLKDPKGYGKSKKKLFTLYVRGVNDKPRITSKPPKTALEGQVYSYYLKGRDAETKYLKTKAIKLPSWLKFDKKKGLLTGKPLHANAGKHKVLLQLSDGQYNVDQSFVISVIALDKAPTSKNAFFTVREDKVLSGSVKAKVRKGQGLSFALVSKPKYGKLTFNKSGAFTYKPKKNYFGNDSFKVEALSRGKSSQSVVHINVNGVNDAPVASGIVVSDVGAGPVTIDWLKESAAKDVDGDKLSLTVDQEPKLGAISFDIDNNLVYIPKADTKGEEVVYLSVNDGNKQSSKITLTLSGIEKTLTPHILQTGQKVIYHPHDDAIYKKSIVRSYEYDLNKTVVKDMALNMAWYVGETKEPMLYKDAEAYCEALETGIIKDWRLPTVKELVMLTDKGTKAPAVDKIFTTINSEYYWTSSDYDQRKNYKWVVYMDYGNDYFQHVKTKHQVQCVREGTEYLKLSDFTPEMLAAAKKAELAAENGEEEPSEVVMTDNNATKDANVTKLAVVEPSSLQRYNNIQVVWDKKHELVWDDRPSGDTATWVGAIKICEQMVHGSRSDWRLPNFNEIYTITNIDGSSPAIKKTFVNSEKKAYWSSTTSDNDSDRAWGITFRDGSDFTYDKTEQIYVRCVRDQ